MKCYYIQVSVWRLLFQLAPRGYELKKPPHPQRGLCQSHISHRLSFLNRLPHLIYNSINFLSAYSYSPPGCYHCCLATASRVIENRSYCCFLCADSSVWWRCWRTAYSWIMHLGVDATCAALYTAVVGWGCYLDWRMIVLCPPTIWILIKQGLSPWADAHCLHWGLSTFSVWRPT